MPLRVEAAFWLFPFDLVRSRLLYSITQLCELDLDFSMFRRAFRTKKKQHFFYFLRIHIKLLYYCSHVHSFSPLCVCARAQAKHQRSIAFELCQTCSIRCSSCCFTLSPYYFTQIGYMIWSLSLSPFCAPVSSLLHSLRQSFSFLFLFFSLSLVSITIQLFYFNHVYYRHLHSIIIFYGWRCFVFIHKFCAIFSHFNWIMWWFQIFLSRSLF